MCSEAVLAILEAELKAALDVCSLQNEKILETQKLLAEHTTKYADWLTRAKELRAAIEKLKE